MPTVLFLCVANSARSQMAEGLARAMAPRGWEFRSAGSEPGRLNPLAVRALNELNIDISRQWAKGLDAIDLGEIETIVTLCADEVCPIVPADVKRLHWALPDPTDMASFRAIRDELRRRLPSLWSDQP